MKKKFATNLKCVLTLLTVIFMSTAIAQRERKESLITQDQINKITELVSPLHDQLEKELSNNETYKAYVEEVTRLNYIENFEEKRLISERIRDNYSSFFKELWSTLRVDEESYQLRIRQVFPTDLSRLITFEPFLVFTLSLSSAATAPPATEPPPPDKCLDICTMAAGEISGTSGLIAASGGSYGDCFLRTNAWSAGFGGNQIFGVLKNNITIPGTLPNDSRKLRVKKNYELAQEATSFATLGGGYAETKVRTRTSSEYMLVYSPVIFGSHSIKIKSMTEEYTLEKKDVALSVFNTYAQTFSAFVSGNWCFSACTSIKWSICEEK